MTIDITMRLNRSLRRIIEEGFRSETEVAEAKEELSKRELTRRQEKEDRISMFQEIGFGRG